MTTTLGEVTGKGETFAAAAAVGDCSDSCAAICLACSRLLLMDDGVLVRSEEYFMNAKFDRRLLSPSCCCCCRRLLPELLPKRRGMMMARYRCCFVG